MRILFVFWMTWFASNLAHGDLRNDFGVGARSSAFAGADRAYSDDGFTVMNNPALMSQGPKSRVTTGFFGSIGSFNNLDNIVVDNSTTGAGSTVYGTVDTKVPDVFLFQSGVVTPLLSAHPEWKIGLALSLPVDKLMELDNTDWYRPAYVMYGSNPQRLNFAMGLSYEFLDSWTVGVGGQVFVVGAANVRARLPQQPASTTTMGTATVVRMGVAPNAGLNWAPSQALNFSLYYAAARDSRLDFNMDNYVYLITSNPLALTLGGSGRLYYDPETYSLGVNYKSDAHQVMGALEYEKWSPYDGSIIKVNFKTTTVFYQFPENSTFHDIFVGRLGYSYKLSGGNILRMGYAYRPTPTPSQSGATNFLDSDRHILAVGGGIDLGTFGGFFAMPVTLDLQGQYQYLIPRDIRKTDPNAIGAPGYTIQGGAWAWGLNLTKEI